jgi:hypothetical protein
MNGQPLPAPRAISAGQGALIVAAVLTGIALLLGAMFISPGMVLLVAGLMLGGALYITPMVIAAVRGVPHVGSVVVVNLLLGFTWVGWVVALAMAVRDVPPGPPYS